MNILHLFFGDTFTDVTSMTAVIFLLPFIGTFSGAGAVFFMRSGFGRFCRSLLLGFAAGVMIAASVWSLLIPAMEMTEAAGGYVWIPAVCGFLCGTGFLLLTDRFFPDVAVGDSTVRQRTKLFILAVTLHNFPEGMAVGVILSGVLAKNPSVTVAGAFALSLGIAIQNIPEGAIISLPLRSEGFSKKRAFLYGVLSGVVEPVGAALTLLLTALVTPILPYLLAFAAGAMIYVVSEELIPSIHEGGGHVGTLAVAFGFALMMLLDVALG